MAEIDDLIATVADPALRRRLATAARALRKQRNFGLIFEEHLPETVLTSSAGLQAGATVVRRNDPKDKQRYQVVSTDGKKLKVTDGTRERTLRADDVLIVKPFGDPAYPVLVPLGQVRRAPDKRSHTIICGENFHALQLLHFQHAGEVDCIYIDPPYNTGATQWKYNNKFVDSKDTFRHSKWLSFMEKRLRIAQKLLKPDGVLIVTIDKYEQAHLSVLLEEIFRQHDQTVVTIVHNPAGAQGDNFSYTNEYAIFLTRAKMPGIIAPRPLTAEEKETQTSPLRNWGGESERWDAAACFYPIYVRGEQVVGFGPVPPDDVHPKRIEKVEGDTVAIWPIDVQGVERKWRYARQSVESIQHLLVVRTMQRGGFRGERDVFIAKETGAYKTVWVDSTLDARTHGTPMVKAFAEVDFPFPKSLYAVYECLRAATLHKPDALVLDFFAGSGTTLHALMLLNTLDDGRRRCVLVSNNEVSEKETKALAARGVYVGDAEFERHGIVHSVTFPRVRAAVLGKPPSGAAFTKSYLAGDRRPWAQGFDENVQAFTLTYANPEDVELGLAFSSILPALWMAAGGVGDPGDLQAEDGMVVTKGFPLAVLLDEDRIGDFVANLSARDDVTHVWLVTDSERNFMHMKRQLPGRPRVRMLYHDFRHNFEIDARIAR
jgi:adenine-specific DNA-methyltransferase